MDMGHGRIENITCEIISNMASLTHAAKWEGISSIVKIDTERTFKPEGKASQQTRY